MKIFHHNSGALAERIACEFLKNQGLILLECNYMTKMGEIDLIMKEKDVIVFIEVKYRKYSYYTKPIQTINALKRKRIIRTALFYLQSIKKQEPFRARFDMIGIEENNELEWIKNIFMM